MWVVVKIMVSFWVPGRIRHLIFRVPEKRDHDFDNHPCGGCTPVVEGMVTMKAQVIYDVVVDQKTQRPRAENALTSGVSSCSLLCVFMG